MKRFFRIENLLLVLPICMVLISRIYYAETFFNEPNNLAIDLNKLIIIQDLYDILLSTLFLLIPFLLHSMLRKWGIGTKWIRVSHVFLTACFFFFSFFSYDMAVSVVPGWHTTIYPSSSFFYSIFFTRTIPSLLFISLQACFALYFTRIALVRFRLNTDPVVSATD